MQLNRAYFFFSSRRRHTRLQGDWSSDVCSSDLGPRLKALAKSFWAMMMPVIILGGLKGGVFTPTEAAVVAAVYALFVSMGIYREMTWSRLYAVFLAAAKTTAVVMFLCGAATVTA